jgi:hypothetical protein
LHEAAAQLPSSHANTGCTLRAVDRQLGILSIDLVLQLDR